MEAIIRFFSEIDAVYAALWPPHLHGWLLQWVLLSFFSSKVCIEGSWMVCSVSPEG